MDRLTITTNNHDRPTIYGYELTDSEKAEFDYIDDEYFDGHNFIKYRGNIIDPEFMRITKEMPDEFQKYDGYMSDSFFSGLLIKYSDDMETYKIATYYS